jgi:cell division protein FtsW (lipid II flippase)
MDEMALVVVWDSVPLYIFISIFMIALLFLASLKKRHFSLSPFQLCRLRVCVCVWETNKGSGWNAFRNIYPMHKVRDQGKKEDLEAEGKRNG